MSEARMQDAMRSCQSRRGWSFDPYAEPTFSVIRVLEVLFRPATLIGLGALGLCVFLIVSF